MLLVDNMEICALAVCTYNIYDLGNLMTYGQFSYTQNIPYVDHSYFLGHSEQLYMFGLRLPGYAVLGSLMATTGFSVLVSAEAMTAEVH